MGVSSELPISGVDMLLGNDLARNQVVPTIAIVEYPDMNSQENVIEPEIYKKKRTKETMFYPAKHDKERNVKWLNLDSLFGEERDLWGENILGGWGEIRPMNRAAPLTNKHNEPWSAKHSSTEAW